MTSPSLIITQLPSSLWNSPLFVAYDYYVGDPLDTLQGDLEDMFYLTDVSLTTNYILNLKFLMNSQFKKTSAIDRMNGFERLKHSLAYTEDPQYAAIWLLRLATQIHQLRSPFLKTGLKLKTNINTAGAIIGPLSSKTSSWPRAFTG